MNYWVVPSALSKYDPEIIRTARALSIDDIVKAVCNYYMVHEKLLYNKNRKREVVDARNIVFYIARKYTRLSLKNVGKPFGKDHTTVIHGIQSFKDRFDTEDKLKMEIGIICQSL